MRTQLVMTIIGPDKPGVVEAVSGVISDHGGNWLESRMAHLAGQFAGILRVEAADADAAALVDALDRLRQQGLGITVVSSAAGPAERPTHRVHLELAGSDHPGIVHQLTEVLAAKGVNIEELSTRVTTTPMSGSPMFVAEAVLQVPASLELDHLHSALEGVAADLMVDIALSDEQD